MTALRLTAVACLALALGACAIGKPAPQATTYVVELPQPVPMANRRPETLNMGKVRVAPAFADKALVYRLGDVQYTPDFYNAFIAVPGDLLGVKMADWLERAGPFKSVSQPGAPTQGDFVLNAAITELYGDFRPGHTPAAVMTVQFSLVDLRDVRPTVVLERSIGRRIDLPEDSAEALVRGYGTALGEILAELAPQMAADRLK